MMVSPLDKGKIDALLSGRVEGGLAPLTILVIPPLGCEVLVMHRAIQTPIASRVSVVNIMATIPPTVSGMASVSFSILNCLASRLFRLRSYRFLINVPVFDAPCLSSNRGVW